MLIAHINGVAPTREEPLQDHLALVRKYAAAFGAEFGTGGGPRKKGCGGKRTAMLGAVAGDIAGSRFEFHNHRSKEFDLFAPECFATDDSIMTLAIAKALMESGPERRGLGALAVRWMREVGRPYPRCGYGGRFLEWMYSESPRPYGSFGNGAAMRVSPCGMVARSIEEARRLSREVTEVTHGHPEGLKGAEAVAVAVYLARTGASKEEIRRVIAGGYYPMDFTLDEIRDSYAFNETCQGTVPQGLEAFFESTGFEDAIRNAISIGGDSDTLAAIAGGVAGAFYGVPPEIAAGAAAFLDGRLTAILRDFCAALGEPGEAEAAEGKGNGEGKAAGESGRP